MKKVLILLGVLLILFSAGGCQKDEGFVIWSFNSELEGLLAAFTQAHPEFEFTHTVTEGGQFQNMLDSAFASGRGVPDVFALDAAFVREYVESGLLLDITDVYERNRDKLLSYPVEIGTYDGRVYALSWQAEPGAVFYRRSLARRYLGTDETAVIQYYLSNFDEFLATAALLSQRSNGDCVIVSSIDELYLPFYGARPAPWVVDGALVIDPVMDLFLDTARALRANGWEGGVSQWSEEWLAGMNGDLTDGEGNPVEVFAYFLPASFYDVLKQNAPDTAGDWAMIEGPAAWYSGGTWIGAWKDTKRPDEAKQMIEWLAPDDGFLRQYALDTGAVTGNLRVTDSLKESFEYSFLGGQNHYALFAAIAQSLSGALAQATDGAIQTLFADAAAAYINGEKTKRQALDDFRHAVRELLGNPGN